MGHLSNPIGFRLSFEKKWNFTFFVKNLYYPEAINNLINIRDYLYYYFTRKKILQSGLCLSHFLLYKYLKKLYIRVYLYHIDLQKTSYDLINKLFYYYYESYNSVNFKFVKNKTPEQLNFYHNLRDLSNSDLGVFLYTYKYFFEGQKKKKKFYFQNNIYLNKSNIKIIKYNKFIIYCYFKQWIQYYRLHKKRFYKTRKKSLGKLKKNPYSFISKFYKFLNTRKICLFDKWFKKEDWDNYELNKKNKKKTSKDIKLAKIKGLVLYKAKKFLKSKPYYKTIIQKSKYLKRLMFTPAKLSVIELAWKITKISLKKISKNKKLILKEMEQVKKVYKEQLYNKKKVFLLQNFLLNFKRLCFFNTYYVLKSVVKGLTKNKRNIKININVFLRDIFYDKKFNNTYNNILNLTKKFRYWLYYSKTNDYKLDIFTLFLYLCKKINFQKVRNSYTLWEKWNIIYNYIGWFYKLNLIKTNNINSILNFMFYMKTTMYFSWLGAAGFKQYLGYPHHEMVTIFPFNFKKHIFNCMYHGVYVTFFKKGFIWMTFFLKIVTFIINNTKDIDKLNNIKFQYIFLSNFNITAQFLARYIVLKLKRGFSVVKTLNPLRKELSRVSIKSRRKQLPYLHTYNSILKRKSQLVKVYKNTFKHYMGSCNTFYYLLFNKYYNVNNILIFPNIYIFYKKFKKKKSKLPYLFKLFNKLKNIFYIYVKFIKIKYKVNTYNKYKILKKGYLLYPLVSNLEKKNIFYPVKNLYRNKTPFDFFNNCFFSVICLFLKIEVGLKKKKINNLQIYFNSFLNKHYIDYTIIKTLWLIYKKFNIRNERDSFVPQYKSLIMGYKLVFKGRFSRKQRASKATLIIGKIPLNTLKLKVDYVFMTVPLKNSAISLKLYLYKNVSIPLYLKNIVI